MILSFGLIALVIILEAGPVYTIFMADVLGKISRPENPVGGAFFRAGDFPVSAGDIYPIHLGRKRLTVK
jgi:hypothetical protein